MKTQTRFNKLTAWLLTLAMLMTFIPGFTFTASAAEIVANQPAIGDGSEDNPYQIGTKEELYWFAQQVNSGNTDIYGRLTADITLNESLESKLTITTTGYAFNYGKATIKSGKTVYEWTAIGNEANAYTGTFDGDGHSVIGLYVNNTNSANKNIGLFGYVKDGTIQNVTVKDSYIGAYSHMGGVVGLLYSGTVKNCHCNDTWLYSSNGRMGGIVGSAHQSGGNIFISDCSSNVVYYQYDNSGGIAGYLRKAIVDTCVFTGELKGTSSDSGGIVGSLTGGSIENCTNDGKINGGEYTGGIAGYSSGDITNCTNNGVITTSSNARYIGGIVGDFYGSSTDLGEITNCTNNGTVTQTGNNSNLSISAGGIVGQAKDVAITDCINNANISGAGEGLGGIVGTQASGGTLNIERCANYGSVIGAGNFAGGIAGTLTYTSLVKDSYNVGDISSAEYPGGIAGYLQGYFSSSTTYTSEIIGCYSAASVSGTKGGAITGRMNYYSIIKDNYYDNTKFTGSANGYTIGSGQTISNNIGKTTDEFANGTVLALLNGDVSEENKIWFQAIGVQETPEFEAAAAPTTYTITISDTIANGTVTADVSEAAEGDTVTLTITPDDGYEIDTVSYNDGTTDTEITEEEGVYSFTMPASDVVITASFEQRPHTHNWKYESVGTDTVKATCTAENCPDTDGGSITIAAPESLDYTGEAIDAVVTNNLVDKWFIFNVLYTAADGSELTGGKPVKVGTYTASINIYGATASVEYSIVPAPVVTSIDFNRDSLAYDAVAETFYVSDDFQFVLEITGENLTLFNNKGGLKALFKQEKSGGWAIINVTIESDTSAYANVDTFALTGILNDGLGSTMAKAVMLENNGNQIGETINVNLEHAPTYKLTLNVGENGQAHHNKTSDFIAKDANVTIIVEPNNGYELESLTVDGVDVTANVVNNEYTFTMPAKAIEVSVDFKALPHTHDWKFAASGNVITATCEGTLGVCPNPTSTVTLVAPENLVYNGSEKVVTTSGTIDSVTIPDVQYEGNRVNAGTFTASLTIDNTTATLTVTITPKSLSGAVIVLDNNTNLGYTGKAITPAVTSVTLDGTTLTADDYTVSYSDNTNAGQATVTVTGKGNYKDTANANFTITKATPVVTAPTGKTGLIYTSEAQALVNAGSTTGGTMQYSLDNVTYNTDIPTGINAGAYTVYYKVVGNDNYNDVSASSVEVTIGKQTVNKPTANIKEYTGTELTADIPTSELYTVSQDPQTETGEYDVTLTLTDVANYKWAGTDDTSVTLKFNITTAINSWKTEPSISGWTFGQTASTPSYEAKFGNSDVKVEYKKATEEDSAYTTTVPTNAGDYKVRFSVASTTNYTALSKVVDLTIAKAQAVITVDTTPIEKFYGEALTLPTATTNIGSVTVDKDVDEMKNKGTYTVTYTVTGTSDYDGDTKTVNVTIKQLPVNITWENAEGLVYNGTEKTITAVLSNKVAGDNVNLTVEGTTSAAEKGTYTATVTAVDNDNYTITNGTNLTKEWAISETANEWTSALSITGWTFGDNANVPTATAKFGTVEFTYADSKDGAFTDTVPTNAGTYYVKATVAGTSSYAEISNTAQFVIEAKELNENNITAIEDKTYTGEEIKPVLEVKDGDIVLVLDTDYEVAYQNNVNAGTAKVVVTFKGNYKGNAEKEFTILKKLIDSAITLTAPVKNTAPQTEITGDGYAATVVWSPEVTDKFGYNTEYTATITITVDENHTVTGIAANGYTVEGAKTVTNEENSNVVTAAYEKTGSRPSSGGGGVSSYTVKFEANGGTAVANKSVTSNSKVTEPTAPTKDGFTFEGWYTDKELTTAYDFDTKVTKSFTLYAKWNEIPTEDDNNPGTSGHNCPSLKFSDLDITQWYHLDTDYVIENDIFRGTTETTFTPNGNITRAMMITVLYRAEGEPEVTGKATFEDIDENAYYAKAVVWGQQNRIIKGYSETEYAPEQDILREQIAAIMHRYAQYKGIDVSVGDNTNILSYDDFDSISEYAIPSMQWAVGSGMIKGRTESTLNPDAFATRVEIAAMLHRFIEANK